MMHYVYIIKCSDGYLYTGMTWNIQKRLKEHREGLSRLTKNRGPIQVVYTEEFDSKVSAAIREKEIKGWSRRKKEALIMSLHRGTK